MTRRTSIVVVAFNRPDLLKGSLQLLKDNFFENITVSVDCAPDGDLNPDIKKISTLDFPDLDWRFRTDHLGIAKHIPIVVSEMLYHYDNVVVLEDDVRVAPLALKSGLELLKKRLPEQFMTIGFFGALGANSLTKKIFGKNSWRETEFFSAWGWGIQRESWNIYKQEMNLESDIRALEMSKTWLRKSSSSRKLWIRRFERVAKNPDFTWDYQMQYASYVHEKNHLLPIFKSADNVGFADTRSSNTKNEKPFWYRGLACNSEITPSIKAKRLNLYLLTYLDRITWSGDQNPPKLLRLFTRILKRRQA